MLRVYFFKHFVNLFSKPKAIFDQLNKYLKCIWLVIYLEREQIYLKGFLLPFGHHRTEVRSSSEDFRIFFFFTWSQIRPLLRGYCCQDTSDNGKCFRNRSALTGEDMHAVRTDNAKHSSFTTEISRAGLGCLCHQTI